MIITPGLAQIQGFVKVYDPNNGEIFVGLSQQIESSKGGQKKGRKIYFKLDYVRFFFNEVHGEDDNDDGVVLFKS